jgi:hypothetical protein
MVARHHVSLSMESEEGFSDMVILDLFARSHFAFEAIVVCISESACSESMASGDSGKYCRVST